MICGECGRKMDVRGFQLIVPGVGAFDRVACAERAARRAGAHASATPAATASAPAAAPVVERSLFGRASVVSRRPKLAAALGLVALFPAVGLAGAYVVRSIGDRPESRLAGAPLRCACSDPEVGPASRPVVISDEAVARRRADAAPGRSNGSRPAATTRVHASGSAKSASPPSGSHVLTAAAPSAGDGDEGRSVGGGEGGGAAGGGGSSGGSGGGTGSSGGDGSSGTAAPPPETGGSVQATASKPGWGYGDENHQHSGPPGGGNGNGQAHAKPSRGSGEHGKHEK